MNDASQQLISTEEILHEVRKLQYLFGLKREIRYKFERTKGDFSESVAEHIYGMHVLAHYFLPLENPKGNWSREQIFSMITWHDIDEIETGDIISYLKTDADRAAEATAAEKVAANMPEVFRKDITALLEDYNQHKSVEARFVKAIDKLEPYVHLYNEEGRKLIKDNRLTYEQSESTKQPYYKDFPIIKQYSDTIGQQMVAESYFCI